MNTLPDTYNDICPSLREELEDSFGVYFTEELIEMYLRGIYEHDHVTLDECENEAEEFVHEYLMDKLQDQY